MRFARGPLLALVYAVVCSSVSAFAEKDVRGVAPKDAHLYSVVGDSKTWQCLHSDQRIPITAINDDYCDCDDGSDEPGTSACPNSTFYCRNEGHIPARIRASRVNDGVCDVECCDGTDETGAAGVQCADVCGSVGRVYRKKKQESDNVQRAGSKIREKYIADRARAVERLAAEVTRLEVDVEVAREREQRAKVSLDMAEKMDETVLQRKRASPLYQTLKSHQDALRALLDKQSTLTTELQKLTSLLDDLAKGYNPNYQDMAVKGAVMAYRSWRRGEEEGGEEDEAAEKAAASTTIDDEEAKRLQDLLSEGDYPRATLNEMVDQDPLSLLDDDDKYTAGKGSGVDEAGILFRIHEYLPDAIVPYFEAAVDTILDLLLKANLITDVKRKRRSTDGAATGGSVETESVVAARATHRAAEQHLRTLDGDLTTKRAELSDDAEKWCQRGEFRALDGTCVERNMGEYTYEFCFFRSATQKPNRGHGNVSLGRFGRFAPRNESITPSDPAFYHRQIYDAGQRCWNGPDRSLIVDFVCATENALLDVFEGEKCIYEAKVSTPAVCLPLEAAAGGGSADIPIKDEL